MKIEIFTLLIVLIIYSVINIISLINNLFLFKNKKDYSQKNKLMVVVSHQDDEIVVAGGLIYKTIKKGGNVKVIFVANGINREKNKHSKIINKEIRIRDSESKRALKYLGVKEKNIIFLRNENEKSLQKVTNIKRNIKILTKEINNYKPDKIITCAYEGGHCDHDATNYIVYKSSIKANIEKENILEATEYNRYYICESIRHRINSFLIIKFKIPPKFIKGKNKNMTLKMNKEEMKIKINSLKYYKSQDPESLIERFGFPDQHRTIEFYNYKNGPLEPRKLLRFKLCMLIRKSEKKCTSFFCGLTYEDYIKMYSKFERELK